MAKIIPSILKKFMMALSGFILVAFVFVHMLGNLQMFCGPDTINEYAHRLQTLPVALLWGFRMFLIFALIIHVWMAILLSIENKLARPQKYRLNRVLQASFASSSMALTGSILLCFIFFHLMHFTLRVVFPEYQSDAFYTMLHGELVYNVYKMVIVGFSKSWVSAFYIIAMALLSVHLFHGVSSMFQSLGICNKRWKCTLDFLAHCYGWAIFLGFISVPVMVLLSCRGYVNTFPLGL